MARPSPFVSVIMPYYNRPEQLRRSLWLLERQAYPEYEVIIVDDGSDLEQALEPNVNPNEPLRVDRIREPGSPPRSPNHAWNRAFALTRGSFIITTHPEILVPRDAIQRIVDQHEKPYRSVPIQYCIATRHQYNRLDRTPWQDGLDMLQLLPNFWTARGPWGFDNMSARRYRSHLSFSGAWRDEWEGLSDEYKFLPPVEDPLFQSDDAWVHVQELKMSRPSRGIDLEVYHQWHERIYGTDDPPKSTRIQWTIQADVEEAKGWHPPI